MCLRWLWLTQEHKNDKEDTTIYVTLQLKDNIECIHLMCALGVVAHISRQINRSIITVYIHHVITSRSSYITSEKVNSHSQA
jgi:hypothetical protein